MSFLQDAVAFTNHYLWDYLLLFLLCGTGVYFTLRLRFIQVLHFGESIFAGTFGGIRLRGAKADGQGMSSFQSLATAVAAQVGTGNLAGAAHGADWRWTRRNFLDVAECLLRHGDNFRRGDPRAKI